MNKLDLRDFFDAYDRGNPYHVCAAGEFYSALLEEAPELLNCDSEWFQTWKWGGKRDLKTGRLLNG